MIFKTRILLRNFYSANSPSHFAITAVARQFPITFTEVLAISINSSIPIIINIGSTGKPNEAAVPIKITKEALGTPATPLLVIIKVKTMVSCCPQVISIPAACATKTEARDKYKVVPSRLKL